ncbi:hypothetical protein CBR_g30779 [Chara braunii]|uniref:PIN domain-containing protein n=1 Tax=Chara braunii TaxID=69332 RepID=A0A388JXF7_CHABU|nr:hypothetical protein CBR_g30779 [Chara braunii]|eukprot:GBG62458.1 hypothetical protein CBR_g30779 [Chara braunii]
MGLSIAEALDYARHNGWLDLETSLKGRSSGAQRPSRFRLVDYDLDSTDDDDEENSEEEEEVVAVGGREGADRRSVAGRRATGGNVLLKTATQSLSSFRSMEKTDDNDDGDDDDDDDEDEEEEEEAAVVKGSNRQHVDNIEEEFKKLMLEVKEGQQEDEQDDDERSKVGIPSSSNRRLAGKGVESRSAEVRKVEAGRANSGHSSAVGSHASAASRRTAISATNQECRMHQEGLADYDLPTKATPLISPAAALDLLAQSDFPGKRVGVNHNNERSAFSFDVLARLDSPSQRADVNHNECSAVSFDVLARLDPPGERVDVNNGRMIGVAVNRQTSGVSDQGGEGKTTAKKNGNAYGVANLAGKEDSPSGGRDTVICGPIHMVREGWQGTDEAGGTSSLSGGRSQWQGNDGSGLASNTAAVAAPNGEESTGAMDWYVVVDTSCFMEVKDMSALFMIQFWGNCRWRLESLAALQQATAEMLEMCKVRVIMVIPQRVVRELDGLKGSPDADRNRMARQALREALDSYASTSGCSADDAILGCCLYYMNAIAPTNTILLTRDIALQVKAYMNGARAYSADEFLKQAFWLADAQAMLASHAQPPEPLSQFSAAAVELTTDVL